MKKPANLSKKVGMGFIEVLIAVVIISACAIPIFYMVTSSRTDTSKAINYLRAVELANEAIEWASVARFDDVVESTFSALAGPITEADGTGLKSISVAVDSPDNPVWSADDLTAKGLIYSEQYNNAFFFREIKIEDVDDSYVRPDLLKKVTVTVKWSEGYRPANLNISADRSRQVELSVLIINDQNLRY